MLITIFTPAYNRAYTLTRLYESLCRQSFRDFEWLIVDDGSTDETEDVVNSFLESMAQADAEGTWAFPIRYIKQPNGGKHRAINRGVREAHGELFFIVDSDDYLVDDALDIIATEYAKVKNAPAIGGVSGFDCYPDGTILGGGMHYERIECSFLDFRFKYRIEGDVAEVYKTSVMREFPFPEIPGEKFCAESLVWRRIATKYKLCYVKQAIYVVEYLADGLSAHNTALRMKSPITAMLNYSELIKYPIPLRDKIKAAINFYRFRFCINQIAIDEKCRKSKIGRPRLSILWIWGAVLGYIVHLYDLKLVAK